MSKKMPKEEKALFRQVSELGKKGILTFSSQDELITFVASYFTLLFDDTFFLIANERCEGENRDKMQKEKEGIAVKFEYAVRSSLITQKIKFQGKVYRFLRLLGIRKECVHLDAKDKLGIFQFAFKEIEQEIDLRDLLSQNTQYTIDFARNQLRKLHI